jgi:hypothetical protein
MFDFIICLILIWIHFIADFVLQNDKMALNKSKSNLWLGIHSIVYILPFFWCGWIFMVINGLSHFIIDYVTSRGTTKLFIAGKRHWFFVLIGFDQALHLSILILTYKFLL